MPILDNSKHELFAQSVAKGKNQSEAAILAGYGTKDAKRQGTRLSTNVHIQARIIELSQRIAERAEIDAAKVLKTLDAIVDADIADLYDENNVLKPVKDWPLVWRKMCVGMEPIFKHSSDGENDSWDQAGYKVKFERGNKAIELLGKHITVNAFVQPKQQIEVDVRIESVERRLQAGRDRIRLVKPA